MRYGVLADIHSNLEALNAVLKTLKQEGAEEYLCLGDVVGYGPSPNETTEIVRSLPGLRIVAGNHDWAVAGKMDESNFNPHALDAVKWTRDHISADTRQFIDSLPEKAEVEDILMVHGSPRDPIEEYLLGADQFWANEPLFIQRVCFVGHSHVPFSMQKDPKGLRFKRLDHEDTIYTPRGTKTIYNPGSVGQPRDGDQRASCAIYDTRTHDITLLRAEYDVQSVQKRMMTAELPSFLIQRLTAGV